MTLQELNFSDLIHYDVGDANSYSFGDYISNGCAHPSVSNYCTSCDELGCNVSLDDRSYKLCNMSHGSHSRDFIDAVDPSMDISEWNTKGVMFVMESPSRDYDIYETTKINKEGVAHNKRPAKQWYWIHEHMPYFKYPKYFCGKEYGRLVMSIVFTFKLANAYLTNLVKCGMNDISGDKYKGIDHFDELCIQNCYKRFLSKEIEIVNPQVMFTFGTKVYNKLKGMVGNKSIEIVGLPHPARRGFKDDYYDVLYFCTVAKWLCRTEVIDICFYNELMTMFRKSTDCH